MPWYYFVRTGRNGVTGWIAYAKPTPFGPNPDTDFDAMREPGEVWFQFGQTSEEALANLRAELTEV